MGITWSGAFDEYAASKRKRGTSEVDAEFLKEMEAWRLDLAGNIALRNKTLSLEDLNTAVQMTIDRVVFLRMAEDRGLEPYEQLLKLCERPDTYRRFVRDLCRKADQKYNSGLFHFQKEPGVSDPPDLITPKLVVDDKVFKPILQGLYFAHGSPYHFGVLPVEILGTVYERFLGNVIRLTAGHQAKIEEKPEVRKAGGVYYTPAFIVDYIVSETVGQQINGRSPTQLAGEKGKSVFRVLDMACGSGSFLLGAYQHLLDHCVNWYMRHTPEKYKKAVYRTSRDGQWRLTIEEKKRILTTHIFGVDIDPQAVEVTKLSLLLKVLEGETEQSISQSQLTFGDRALPNLADNIKCGNSLVGHDYFAGKLIVAPEEMRRVNPFDWEREFPRAMKAGGFDCIIGNPPYISIRTMNEWAPLEVGIYKELFRTARTGSPDIYVVFVEQGLKLLNARGQLGFILPSKFFTTDYGAALREIITSANALRKVVDFGHAQVFEGASNYTCLLFLSRAPVPAGTYAKVESPSMLVRENVEGVSFDNTSLSGVPWSFAGKRETSLARKLLRKSIPLGKLPARIARGSSTGNDDVFILIHDDSRLFTRRERRAVRVEKSILRTPIYATDFGRYGFAPQLAERIVFPYDVTELTYELKPESVIIRDFPKRFCLMASAGFSITVDPSCRLSPNYMLGLLNSKLLFWRLRSISNIFRGGWITCTKQYVETLPIRTIDFSDHADNSRHDRIVTLVDSILELHKQLAAAQSTAQRNVLQRQIDATDGEIDKEVYGLYGLTAEEAVLVERALAPAATAS